LKIIDEECKGLNLSQENNVHAKNVYGGVLIHPFENPWKDFDQI